MPLLHGGGSPPQPINNASKHSSVECVRLGLYGSSDPTPTQLAEDADERLFESIKYSEHHVLQQFLPEQNSHSYSLQPRRHNFSLATKTDDRNFVTRQLFTNIY